jgi:xanthine/uracil permease
MNFLDSFFGALERVRFQVLALVVGALFVLLAFYQVKDIKTLALVQLPTPSYPVFFVGLVLIMVAVIGTAAPSLRPP